jgi:hypothetical protein
MRERGPCGTPRPMACRRNSTRVLETSHRNPIRRPTLSGAQPAVNEANGSPSGAQPAVNEANGSPS